jgi:thymidylate synthase
MIISDSITDLYLTTLKLLKEEPIQPNGTKELINFSMCLTDPLSRFITSPERKHSVKYMCGELVWYISGSKNVHFISKFSKFWNQLADQNNEVNSNYGEKIWHKKIWDPKRANNLSQEKFVISELIRDNSTRKAIMFFNLLDDDYHKMSFTKDFPCTLTAQFLIRNNKLHMIINMRSNDLIFGWCNDVPFFTLIQERILRKLNFLYFMGELKMGHYFHNAGSLHIYPHHFNHFNDTKIEDREDVFPKMEVESFEHILKMKPKDDFSKFVLKQIE